MSFSTTSADSQRLPQASDEESIFSEAEESTNCIHEFFPLPLGSNFLFFPFFGFLSTLVAKTSQNSGYIQEALESFQLWIFQCCYCSRLKNDIPTTSQIICPKGDLPTFPARPSPDMAYHRQISFDWLWVPASDASGRQPYPGKITPHQFSSPAPRAPFAWLGIWKTHIQDRPNVVYR